MIQSINVPFIATILTILSNAMVGDKISTISNMNKLNITPSNFTFSIWGVIYSLLLYSMFVYGNTIDMKFLSLYIVSCILNSIWLQTWSKNMMEVSCIILILLSINLFIILSSLNNNNNIIHTITFMIYGTWVLVACLLNIGIILKKYNIANDMILKYGIAIILTLLPILLVSTQFIRNIIPILLTIVWASFGIIRNGNTMNIMLMPIITNLLLCLYK
jgi:benzodiazapine receptor